MESWPDAVMNFLMTGWMFGTQAEPLVNGLILEALGSTFLVPKTGREPYECPELMMGKM